MEQKRIFWLDLVRSAAILLVILNHAVELTYPLTLEGWHECTMVLNVMKVVGFSVGRLGVPLFYVNKKILERVPLWVIVILGMAGFGMTVYIQIFAFFSDSTVQKSVT